MFLKAFDNLQSKQSLNNKTFEHANLIFAYPWELANEIMLNAMQNSKIDFLENEFWAVPFKFHFQDLT